MEYLYITLIIMGTSFQNICLKSYNSKAKGGAYTFTAASIFFTLLFFILSSGGSFALSGKALLFSIGFAIAYSTCIFANFLAIATGPLSLTGLILQYSLMIPTLYGLVVLDEPVDFMLIAGILLLFVSLFFINMEKKGEEKKITLRWGIYAFLAFVGNGACSTIQKAQQLACDGMHKSQFMIVALLISAVVLGAIAVKREKELFLPSLKCGFPFAAGFGLANGMVNLLVIVLATMLPASVLFPVISAGGIIITVLLATIVYKETLSGYQIIGFILGIGAIVALNL